MSEVATLQQKLETEAAEKAALMDHARGTAQAHMRAEDHVREVEQAALQRAAQADAATLAASQAEQ